MILTKFVYLLLKFQNSLHTGKKREFLWKNQLFPVFPEVQKVRKIANPTTVNHHIQNTIIELFSHNDDENSVSIFIRVTSKIKTKNSILYSVNSKIVNLKHCQGDKHKNVIKA